MRPALILRECSLHQHGVHPTSEFKSDVRKHTYGSKSKACMQTNGGLVVTVADDCHHLAATPPRAQLDQVRQQAAAQSLSDESRVYVDGVLYREAIGGTRTVRPCVRVTHNPIVKLRHNKRQTATY